MILSNLSSLRRKSSRGEAIADRRAPSSHICTIINIVPAISPGPEPYLTAGSIHSSHDLNINSAGSQTDVSEVGVHGEFGPRRCDIPGSKDKGTWLILVFVCLVNE